MKTNKEAARRVIEYIEANLDKEIDLDAISKGVGYSKHHLNRMFTEETGCTICKYLQLRRLTVAAQQLIESDKAIAQIAYDMGYHSQQAFTLAFKQLYLCPPKAYRDRGIYIPKQQKLILQLQSCTQIRQFSMAKARRNAA